MGDCPWWHHWYPIELFKVPIILGNIIKNPILKDIVERAGEEWVFPWFIDISGTPVGWDHEK